MRRQEENGKNNFVKPPKYKELKAEYDGKIYMIKNSIKQAKKYNHPEMVPDLEIQLEELEQKRNALKIYCPQSYGKFHIYKHMKIEKIETYAREYIQKKKDSNVDRVLAEELAYELNVKSQYVKQVFRKLKKEGILSLALKNTENTSPYMDNNFWVYGMYTIN